MPGAFEIEKAKDGQIFFRLKPQMVKSFLRVRRTKPKKVP